MSTRRPLDIITAINLTRKYEYKDASHKKMEETTTLRFKVGDRVACYTGEGYETGTVIKLWYTEKYFPEGCANRLQSLVPYQVRLDNDNTVYAKEDEDRCIKISNTPHVCGNCGKEESSDNKLKACTSCKMVKYCNRQCQKAHRKKHMELCTKQAARLHEEALFKDHPPTEECPICLIPLPLSRDEVSFKTCCGKTICHGCAHAILKEEIKNGNDIDDIGLCAFCRLVDVETDEKRNEQVKILVEKGNAYAHSVLARYYAFGQNGYTRNQEKSNELLLKAGKLGESSAY